LQGQAGDTLLDIGRASLALLVDGPTDDFRHGILRHQGGHLGLGQKAVFLQGAVFADGADADESHISLRRQPSTTW
jgi:hypothetical protein